MADEATEAPSSGGESAPEQGRTFTQADIDKAVQDRLHRERQKFADYDELKAKVDAQKSEAERAVEAARAEGAKEVASKYQKRLFEAEVRSHAAALKFRDAGDALSVFGDSEGLVSDDGSVDGDAIAKRLTEIANAKPYLVDTPPQVAKRPTLKSRGTQTTDDQAKPSRAADALRAFAAGR